MPSPKWQVYRCGAQLPSLKTLIEHGVAEQIENLQRAISSVALVPLHGGDACPNVAHEDDVFVANLLLGIICRGWPTLASPRVEEALLNSIDRAAGISHELVSDQGRCDWALHGTDGSDSRTKWTEYIRAGLLRGDARLVTDAAMIREICDSKSEQAFYEEHLSRFFGSAIGWVELQRPLATMIREDIDSSKRYGTGRVDFSLELPGSDGRLRHVFEYDGPHHRSEPYVTIDRERDVLLRNHQWSTSRVSANDDTGRQLHYLEKKIDAILGKNQIPIGSTPIHSLADDICAREVARLLLTPHAVARIQLSLCRALIDGALRISSPQWTLAIVEREAPCAELAVRDFFDMLRRLCPLYSIHLGVTRVRLLVADDHLVPMLSPVVMATDSDPSIEVARLEGLTPTSTVDVAIDVSIGAHPTRRYPRDLLSESNLVPSYGLAVRTAQRQSGYVVLAHVPSPKKILHPLEHEEDLTYFLQLLFRKKGFRPGQLDIIERVLRRQDVIGLLPTGAGKSITFQLPALLSPGMSLVIDPLKSLMLDQVENLKGVGIDDAIQINSDTSTSERTKIEWQLLRGEYRLIFISPERLQIRKFRESLVETARMRPISYVIVDEAHCVSEWGHDFRMAYLNLGRIAKDYCGANGVRPPIVAVTGTASEAVLRDIKRELEIDDDNAIVRPAEFNRSEIKFEIVRVNRNQKLGALVRLIGKTIPNRLGSQPDILSSGACGGIVFCPHVKGALGVFDISQRIPQKLPQFQRSQNQEDSLPLVGYFSGEAPPESGKSETEYVSWKQTMQRGFKVGSIPLLVATSAFGMGIDKPNIRYTVHLAMPPSIEAFAQEAGRAGRDRKEAICTVLFTDRHAIDRADSRQALEDPLAPGISVEEAKRRSDAVGYGGDDADIQMYLHSKSYHGVERESTAVRALYRRWIKPRLDDRYARPDAGHEISIGEREYRATIEADLAALIAESSEAAVLDIVLDDGREGDVGDGKRAATEGKTPELQRLIYRLSLVGIVTDYTIVHSPGNGVFMLTARALGEAQIGEYLDCYLRRYIATERGNEARQIFRNTSLSGDPVERAVYALCWFIYQEIEQRRRQAMANMRDALRGSATGADLADRINRHLSNSSLTRRIFDALSVDDYRAWLEISQHISSAESGAHVYAQCQRALEDAPGHPGLLLLTALGLHASEPPRANRTVDLLRNGFAQITSSFARPDARYIARWAVGNLARHGPDAAIEVLDHVLLADHDPLLASVVLEKIRDGTLIRNERLERTCLRCVLNRFEWQLAQFVNG